MRPRVTEQEVQGMLDRLADLQAQQDVIAMHFQELRSQVLTPEIMEQIEEIDEEEATSLDALRGGIEALQQEIKTAVIYLGHTIKSENVQAIYAKPRITWNTKELDGYATANPEINKFRKVGSPSVRIQRR